MKKYVDAQAYFDDDHERSAILNEIRAILLSCDLEETIKWFLPTYLHQKRLVIGLGHFKEFVSIWFHHGVFLSDPLNVLINAQKGKTMGLRQWRFTSMKDIDHTAIKMYVKEAIKNSEEGLEIKAKAKPMIAMPELLQKALDDDPSLVLAYDSLTRSKQNEYKEYIINAKREATKYNRLEKIKPMILSGIGLHDKYRKSK